MNPLGPNLLVLAARNVGASEPDGFCKLGPLAPMSPASHADLWNMMTGVQVPETGSVSLGSPDAHGINWVVLRYLAGRLSGWLELMHYQVEVLQGAKVDVLLPPGSQFSPIAQLSDEGWNPGPSAS